MVYCLQVAGCRPGVAQNGGDMMGEPVRKPPVLRYFGGKHRLAPWIVAQLPQHSVYVEPFCGASSVFFLKSRSNVEVLNDLSGAVVNVLRVLRDQGPDLYNYLRLMPWSRQEFYAAREEFPDTPVKWAAMTIFRSFSGYGSSGLRVHNTGFRGAFGEGQDARRMSYLLRQWTHIPDFVEHYSTRLRGCVLESFPGIDFMQRMDAVGVLFYVDPPYCMEVRRESKRNQYIHEFADKDHAELFSVLQELKGMAVLSGYPDCLYDDLGWRSVDKRAYSLNGSERCERLWFSPNCKEQLGELFEQTGTES